MGLVEGILVVLFCLAMVAIVYELGAMVYRDTDGFSRWPGFRRYRCEGEEFGVCGRTGPHTPDCPQSTPGEKYYLGGPLGFKRKKG